MSRSLSESGYSVANVPGWCLINRTLTPLAELVMCSRRDYATALPRSACAISAPISSAAARGFAAAVIGRPTTK
jgi:hypothetical protein